MHKCFLWTILTHRWMPFAQNIWGIVSSINNINFSLYDIAKTHKWEKDTNLTSKWRVGGSRLAVPLLFTELLTRQMGIYTVSFRHLTCVWFRVKSLSSLYSQQNQLCREEGKGRRFQEHKLVPAVNSKSGCECLWSWFSVFKGGPWINSESLNKDYVQ